MAHIDEMSECNWISHDDRSAFQEGHEMFDGSRYLLLLAAVDRLRIDCINGPRNVLFATQ